MSFQPIFQNPQFNTRLSEEGYAIVPFLTQDEVSKLTQFFYTNHSSIPQGMYATSHAADMEFRKSMNDAIQKMCQRAMQETFSNVQPLGATFMVKSKGEQGSLKPHQDWSIVDETQFFSYNIWLPLVSTNTENGTLEILPQSHVKVKSTRGLGIPCVFQEVLSEVWDYLTPISVKAGDAVVYDHRLLHASRANQTEIPRLVIVYGIIPSGAEMRFYYGQDHQIQTYSCDASFYFNADISKGPVGLPLLGVMPNKNETLDSKALKKRFKQSSPSLFQKMWQQIRR